MLDEDTVASLRSKLADRALAALEKSATTHVDADAMGRQIVRDLEQRKSDVIWRLLGLDNRWGKWEVDHCNGRQSPITQYLAANIEPLVKEWVNGAVADVLANGGTKMRTEIRTAITKEIRARIGYAVRKVVEDQLDAVIKQECEQLVNDTVKGAVAQLTEERN